MQNAVLSSLEIHTVTHGQRIKIMFSTSISFFAGKCCWIGVFYSKYALMLYVWIACLQDFLNFTQFAEDKTHRASQLFWFSCADIDGDGYIGRHDVRWLYDHVR